MCLHVGTTESFASQNDSAVPQRTLTVSAATDSYPYSFIDSSGKLTGYGVDLLDAIAAVMHVRLQRIEVPAEEDVANLNAQRYDIGQFHAPRPDRTNNALFSQPVLINYGEIFVRRRDHRFRSLDDIRRARARIAAAQQGFDYLTERGFRPDLIFKGTSGQCLSALSKGDVDAVLLTRLTGLSQLQYLHIGNIEAIGANLPDFKVSFSIATRQDDTELLGQINEALATLSITGRTEEIYTRWFGRFESRALSSVEIMLIATASLSLALLIALWALQHQRALRRRIARQAAELRESRENLAEAQRFARLGHWRRLVGSDAESIWSAETYRIFERDPALPSLAIHEALQLAVGDDRERWRVAIEQAYSQARAFDLDVNIEPKAGLRKVIHVNARAVLDEAGKQIGVFGTVQDVTAPRAAEVMLRRSEKLLRALYANLPLGLGVVERSDNEWRIVSLNPAAVRHLALASEPSAGCPLLKCGIARASVQDLLDLLDRATKGNQPVTAELTRRDLHRVYSVVIIPLESVDTPSPNDPQACFLIEDVTDRQRQDAELSQGRRLRAIGELVGGIAHEFNNLLTPIRLTTQMLQKDWAHQPALCSDLKLISGAAERSAELVRRLLAFGRRTEARPEMIAPRVLVDSNLDLLRHTIDRRIEIVSTVPGDLPELYLSNSDLHQIILNLLLNARDTLMEKLARNPPASWQPRIEVDAQALPPGSVVPLADASTQSPHSWIRLTVRDTGQGMTPEVLERLFEPFYTTKDVGRGTGLGLATVWHHVREIGGRIDVESVLGAGSAFHLSLPVLDAPSIATPQVPTPSPPGSIAARHFLILDDEAAIARVVTRFLRNSGHTITAVTDPTQAWSIFSGAPHSYDAVLLDLNMPGMNGVEFIRRARALTYHKPIFVMTGRLTDADRNSLLRLSVAAVLNKPFSLEELQAAVAAAFEKSTTPSARSVDTPS